MRQERSSVLRVHWTRMSRYSGKEERKERTAGRRALSGFGGGLSTSSSRTVWRRISREWEK